MKRSKDVFLNTNKKDEKDIASDPGHQFNPFPGNNYFGKNQTESAELENKSILKLETRLLSDSLSAEVRSSAKKYATKLERIREKGITSHWIEISRGSVLTHEEAHREQERKFNYLKLFGKVSRILKKIENDKKYLDSAKLKGIHNELDFLYKNSYVLMEVQALIRGLRYVTKLEGQRGQVREAGEGFALSWMARVYVLFEKFSSATEERSVFDEIFSRICKNNLVFDDMNDVINHLARIVMLTGDIEILAKIKEGKVEKAALIMSVISRLEEFESDPSEFISKVICEGLCDDKLVSNGLKKLKTALAEIS